MKYLKNFNTLLEYEDALILDVPNTSYIIENEEVKYSEEPKVGSKYIVYKSSNGNVVNPYDTTVFGASLISNNYDDVGLISFDGVVTSIGKKAFYYRGSLTSVAFGNSVMSIGSSAFEYCSSLTSVAIGNSVTSIGSNAFSSCSGLTSITIPNSVTSIGDGAFYGCSKLTSITIGNSVTSILGAFNDCYSLTSILVEKGNTTYDSRNNCNAIIHTATNLLVAGCQNTIIPNSVTSIGNNAFWGHTSLTSITIPDSVTSIGSHAFYKTGIYNNDANWEDSVLCINNCLIMAKTSISGDYTIATVIRLIGESAFSGCKSLTSIVIPDSITNIASNAFYGCSALTSITIPNGVTEIGGATFYGCSSLTSVTIPESVTSIGQWAFKDCSSLKTIICQSIIPPTLESNSLPSVTVVYVPAESVEAYKTATNWVYYAGKIQPI